MPSLSSPMLSSSFWPLWHLWKGRGRRQGTGTTGARPAARLLLLRMSPAPRGLGNWLEEFLERAWNPLWSRACRLWERNSWTATGHARQGAAPERNARVELTPERLELVGVVETASTVPHGRLGWLGLPSSSLLLNSLRFQVAPLLEGVKDGTEALVDLYDVQIYCCLQRC